MLELISKREEQIIKFGCPLCGTIYDIHISNVEDKPSFKCPNEECNNHKGLIPYEEADKCCPQRESIIEAVYRRRGLISEAEVFQKTKLGYAKSQFKRAKASSAIHQRQVKTYKECVAKIKELRMFDKEGKRMFDDSHPFFLPHPVDGTVCRIAGVRAKRKFFKMASALWWVAKDKLNNDFEQMRKWRGEIGKIRPRIASLHQEIDELEHLLWQVQGLNLQYLNPKNKGV